MEKIVATAIMCARWFFFFLNNSSKNTFQTLRYTIRKHIADWLDLLTFVSLLRFGLVLSNSFLVIYDKYELFSKIELLRIRLPSFFYFRNSLKESKGREVW